MNGQEDIQYHAKVFFMRAAEFLEAADELFASENRTPLKWWYPTYFLYAHATELALKAFWRAHNLTVERTHSLVYYMRNLATKVWRLGHATRHKSEISFGC